MFTFVVPDSAVRVVQTEGLTGSQRSWKNNLNKNVVLLIFVSDDRYVWVWYSLCRVMQCLYVWAGGLWNRFSVFVVQLLGLRWIVSVCVCVLACVVEWSRTLDVRLDVYVFYMRHTLPYRLVLGSVDCNLAHSSDYSCPLGLIKLLVCRSLFH